ncbi:MAG: N-acetylneuraminate synthase family protein [Treponema sp.]|nr:N-acetylneuraminate synthase family protein [Treponema sp.]
MIIVAEIGTSHGGSLEKAKKLIDTAVESGADAVKLQWVYADEILHPDTGFVSLPTGNIRLYDRFKELEVPPAFFSECRSYAHQKGVQFICSPFGLRSLEELISIHPDAIKIASPELNHIPLLKSLAQYRKKEEKIPVVISSGVSTLADIEAALSILGTDNVTLLHCITSYPAPESEYNLRLVRTLSQVFGVQTGVSDHSLDPILVPSLGAAMGAVMLEKHITLSKETAGLDDPVALDGEQFSHMCYCVRQCNAIFRRYEDAAPQKIISQMEDLFGTEKVSAALGDGIKRLAPSERANYGRTNRSLHYLRAMKAGEKITAQDIGVLRTEKVLTPGISPLFLNDVLGAVITRGTENGAGVQWDDLFQRV